MPRYQIYFDTSEGERKFNVDIDDSEIIDTVLRDILGELAERGLVLRGVATGELRVIWNGQELDLSRSLPEQQVMPNEVLRVLVESYTAGAGTVRAQRIEHEWYLLNQLRDLNPKQLRLLGRKSRPNEETLFVELLQSPGIEGMDDRVPSIRQEHTLRLCFPRFYPDVPIECYVKEPLFHPNVRPDNGFICLWERFNLDDTAIQAVCRAQAMAAYRMMNLKQEHVMNPEAAEWYEKEGQPRALVPVDGPELTVFRLVSGRLEWLEPARSTRGARRWAEL
jgi:Ubiquitin-conjugating enzyme